MDPAPSLLWPVPAGFPALAPAAVHVWCAWLDAPGADDERATAILSAREQARAAAFHFAAERRRYRAAHAILRRVLAGYLGTNAATLDFLAGSFGKPALADGALHFNLSHSGPLALLAVARDQAVGIDVELRGELPDLAMLEERMFMPAALRRQQRLGPGPRLRGFYRRWTQLEAIGKCRGTGLDLEQQVRGAEHVASADPAEGFTGCLACERAPAATAFFQFPSQVLTAPPETTAPAQPIIPGLPHRLRGLAPLSSP